MIHVSEKKQGCCGCNACAQICPQECISMVEDPNGFLYPEVDADRCIECNLCEKACPIMEKKDSYEPDEVRDPKAIGGWHKDEDVRFESSSGGAFTLFAEHILAQGGVVYGSYLKEDFRAQHICVERMEDLGKLKGSKYIQSDISNVYQEIKEHLDNNRKVMFVGTPCQCAGLHSFLQTVGVLDTGGKSASHLYTCDFICHGVPSPKIFRSYINYLEHKYKDKVIAFRFRNKDKGWNPSGLQMGTKIEFLHSGSIRLAPAFRDAYMNGFLDDVYLRPSCYSCEFKSLPKYYSDITIADFWGVKQVDAELCDGKGTSLVLLHNEHGQRLFDTVKENFVCKEVDFKSAIRRNKSLICSARTNPRRDRFFYDYDNMSFQKVMRKYMSAFSWASHKIMKIAWNCMELLIKIILKPVLRILRWDWDDSKWEDFMQFVKFSLVGLSNVVVSYTINISTLFLLRHAELTFDYAIANLTAFVLSVLWSYHWNSTYVFHPDQMEKGWRIRTLARTYISYALTGIVLNNILSTLWIRVLGFSKFIAPLLNLPFSVPTNFVMHKLWAYKVNDNNDEKIIMEANR